jgi:drug/metabolite transporter (DMT)-like permease
MAPSSTVKALSFAVMVAIWGTTWSVIRVGLHGIPPLTGVALRFGIAGAVLWVVALAVGLRGERLRAPLWLWAIQGLLTFAVCYGLVYWAEQWVPSGLTALLFATFPLWVAVLSHFFLPGERMRPISVVGLVVALVGVALLFSQDLAALGGPRVLFASAVTLLAPLSSAVAQTVVKRQGKSVHPITLNAGGMVVCALVIGALALLFERGRPVRFDLVSVSALLYLSLFGTVVTFSLYFWMLHHVRATRLSLIAYCIPVVAVIVGALALDEPVTGYLVLGGLLVVAGTALASVKRSSPAPARPAQPEPTETEGQRRLA